MQSFKKPDLNGPRYRPKKQNILNIDLHKRFLEKYPKYKGVVSHEQMKDIVTSFNTAIWEEVIDNRDGVELPEQLGYVFIGTCPKKIHSNIDYKTSGELGIKVQNQNWESDQYLAKIFYTNYENKYSFRFHELWSFVGVRDFKRSVAKTYPKEWKKYIMMDDTQQTSKIFRKQVVKDFMKNNIEIIPESYDEFAF